MPTVSPTSKPTREETMHNDDRILELESTMAELKANHRRRGWRTRWAAIGAAVAISVGGGGALHYASAAPGDVVQNSFVPVTPVRILDTRPAPENVGGFVGPLVANQTHTFQVTGLNGVPDNATSVVINVAVTGTTAPSFLTLFPAGAAQPVAANLNWPAGTTISNLVTVAIGSGGQLSVFNLGGNAHVIADLAGYYVPGNDKFVAMDVLGHPDDTAIFDGGFGSNAGIAFVDGSNTSASFSLVLPPDYTPGGEIIATFTWHTSSVSCGVNWRGNFVSVSRAGQIHLQGSGASSGMSSPGVLPVGVTSNFVREGTITLTAPTAAETLLPGDSFTFSMFRSGGSADDTCGSSAKIDSMVVTYE